MIPNTLHFLWVGSPEPMKYLNSWKTKHPLWTVRMWDENSAMKATGIHVNHIENPWVKSMVLRLALLEKFGGVYADYDLKCIKSCDDVAQQGSPLFMVHNSSDFIKNRNHAPDSIVRWSFMGAEANHPFLREVLDYILGVDITGHASSSHSSRKIYQSIGKLFEQSPHTGDVLLLPSTTITKYRGPSYPLTIAFHCTPSSYPWRNGTQRAMISIEIWMYENPVAGRVIISFFSGFVLAMITMVITDAVRKNPKYKLNK